MLLTLLKGLNTNELMEVVGSLTMSPLDIDLLFYDEQELGNVGIDKKKGTITALKEAPYIYHDELLAHKLAKIIKRYDEQDANITRSRMEEIALDLVGGHGYPIHEFICALYALEQGVVKDEPQALRYEISVPELKGKRPAHMFVFYTFTGHKKFGEEAVKNFVDHWAKAK